MIDIKMLKGTGPYNQMKRYIESEHKDLTPQQRAGKFTALLKKFVFNANTYDAKNRPGAENKVRSIGTAFAWIQTPEGLLWQSISRLSTAPLVKQPVVENPAPVGEQPNPADPVLVWPKGFYHYSKSLNWGQGAFFNKEGKIGIEGKLVKWNDPKGTFPVHERSVNTIKRPETPLPNGLQWEGDYTYYDPSLFRFAVKQGFFFKEREYIYWHEHAWRSVPLSEEDFKNHSTRPTAIQRYPDNQPVILDMPPQAPIMPVQQRKAEPVPQAPVVENVAVKVPVEAPKAAKKPVGWWA